MVPFLTASALGSWSSTLMQQQLSQQMMNQQQQRALSRIGLTPYQIGAPVQTIHVCSYCGRPSKAPDHEAGCTGCGAREWE